MFLYFHFILGWLKGLDSANASSHKHTMANQRIEHVKWPAFQHTTNLNFSIQAEHSSLSLGIS